MRRSSSFWHILIFVCSLSAALGETDATPEQRANRYLENIRRQPALTLAFLREMPKGGDLHNHLFGSSYAEDLIEYAISDHLCLDRANSSLVAGPCDGCGPQAIKPAVECGRGDPQLYATMIDAWSMRNWRLFHESGHDHFFQSFTKFDLATRRHAGAAVTAAMERAAADHLEYLELMHTLGGSQAAEVGSRLAWNSDLAAMREQFLAGGIKETVAAARRELDENDALIQEKLACQTPSPEAACQVTVRYLYQVLRGLSPQQVFAQMLTGFELVSADSRVIGLNLVMPEDWYVPMRDFHLHMKMLDFLHSIYPKVHISLHAGELAMGLVPPEGLRFHIRESIALGHAERIGHGVDVMNEQDPIELLKEMARRKVLVEICLTSNAVILGVAGEEHPFPLYRRYHVPVALATDDEGVSRSDMTHEYLRAVATYGLSYPDLKAMARESLEHSFLPGASFWQDLRTRQATGACRSDGPSNSTVSLPCRKFLEASQKAQMQWKLEQDFAGFEKRF